MRYPSNRLPPRSLDACRIAGCSRKAVAFHLCSTHYSKLKKYGDPLAGRTNSGGVCRIEGCGRHKKAKDLCSMHYERATKHGDPLLSRKPSSPCKVDGCEGKPRGHGWCEFHYGRWRNFGDPLAGGERRAIRHSLGACRVDGCGRKAMSRHLCVAHYAKWQKFGDPLGGTVQDGRSKKWHIRKGGYVIRFDRSSPHAHPISGIVLQHRQVMSEMLGRPLRSDEMVHHKNGERADNRRRNLELCLKRQPPGQRVKDLVKWARELLRDYGKIKLYR